MTVNIPGIIPGIYFYFLTTLKYMIGHRQAVKIIEQEGRYSWIMFMTYLINL